MIDFLQEINKRRTFAIISHPDAGKTTLTEKLLLFGGAIQLAGAVKGKKASRSATSDFMALEKERGISVSTSAMQFEYRDRIINLLDTPGHEDFSEDTYRTLTAVDSALMVIDAAKGVEPRTIKLMEVCRLRDTPITTFINKLDREGRNPIELLDEIESILKIKCTPVTWPIGMGKRFKGIYHLWEDAVYLYESGKNLTIGEIERVEGLDNPLLQQRVGRDELAEFLEELELVREASPSYDPALFLKGQLTPVYFGSAVNNFGVRELLNGFVQEAPSPLPRQTETRQVNPQEAKFTGFVFKIQANMDPLHRDRIAFVRITSGKYEKNMKFYHVRTQKQFNVPLVLTFLASKRENQEEAYPGDIIGVHNHGSIQIGDTFTMGESLQFLGIPHFAPELFRRVRLKDPLKQKALLKGLLELSEEGATQVFRPISNNDLIVGAVGNLQFDVVAHRLQHEYGVPCVYESINVVTARWISSEDATMLAAFKERYARNLALDHANCLTFLAPSRVNLEMAIEEWPKVRFESTKEL